jgi:hypothetical protein
MYNSAKHSATKKPPFILFLNIPGLNTVSEDLEDVYDDENEIKDVVIPSEEDEHDLSKKNNMNSSIDQKYLDRMDRHSLVHSSIYKFEISDKVIVAEDFDTKIKTKKTKTVFFLFGRNGDCGNTF